VATFRDQFVVANGAGQLYLLKKGAADGALTSQHLPYAVPMNAGDFSSAAGSDEDQTYFRTADLFVQDLGQKTRLFASHHYWKADAQCFVVRVSMLETDTERFMHGAPDTASWETIFESTPCVPLKVDGKAQRFGGIQSGGHMALLNPHELLVAMGDHERDGVNTPESYSQDPNSSYGKTVLLDLNDFSSQLFSVGHRNPQGLFVDGPDGIWLTEHGPQGGDELNKISRGANYGWPLASYGTQYGEHFWPGDPVAGSHESMAQPFYSWVPSIGISSLMVAHGQQFKLWDRDLLVTSLKDGAI
jgi:hypothetical protein